MGYSRPYRASHTSPIMPVYIAYIRAAQVDAPEVRGAAPRALRLRLRQPGAGRLATLRPRAQPAAGDAREAQRHGGRGGAAHAALEDAGARTSW